jgi:radical SAM superfamily enzyme YgiQ (UPF0313 family)
LFILGGHLVSPDTDYFKNLTGADYVLAGYCEDKLPELLGQERVKESYKNEIYFKSPMNIYRLKRYPGIKPDQFGLQMLTGRGCPYNCNFCYKIEQGYELFPIEKIKNEIKLLYHDFGISYFYFCDDLTMAHGNRIDEICKMISGLRFNINWGCNGRLNIVNEYMLREMEKSGCVFINYGIESMDNTVLKNMNKRLTKNQITKGIEATLKTNINPGFNFIWGNIGDTKETLWECVSFLLEYDNQGQRRTIRPVTPYPGTPLYYKAIEDGLLTGIDDFYKKHINSEFLTVNFTELSDGEFHYELRKANLILTHNYYSQLDIKDSAMINCLYNNKLENFRGFR